MRDAATAPVLDAVCAAVGRVGAGLYLVACSGGADSLALADATIAVAGAPHVMVVAVDHGLTPAATAAAVQVQAWARARGAAGLIERVTVARQASLEAAARDARYAALARVADATGASAVLLGHTARDQAETILMRILRGTGPAGLVGMAPVRDRYVRPLLALTRPAIDRYATARALPVWDDPMNADAAFTRVRLRATVLPQLRAENPRVEAALLRLGAAAGEWLAVIDALARPFARLPIDCGRLAREPAAIRKRALAVAFELQEATHLDRLDALVTAPARGEITVDLPRLRARRTYDTLTAVPAAPEGDAATAAMHGEPRPAAWSGLDAMAYQVRCWAPGDRMAPARLQGRTKKLSDLFGEARIPRANRRSARVVIQVSASRIVYAEHVGLAHAAPADLVRWLAESAGSFH